MKEHMISGKMPVLALRGLVVYPDQTIHFDVGRPKSVMALDEAMKQNQLVFLVPQRNIMDQDPALEDLHTIGVVARVKQVLRTQGENLRVLVTGVCRGRIQDLTQSEPYLWGYIQAVSETELANINSIVSPLLRKGQSLHHICANHADELMVSERSLYTYVNNNLLDAINLDMPRTVRMRPRKKKSTALKVDKKCRIGRTYDDFNDYLEEHPDTPFRECDTVEGIKGGKVLLTIHFVQQELQLAFLRDANDSRSVTDIFERLYLALAPESFMELFPVLLCDNGSEFSNPAAIEFDGQGNRRTRVFYCNANASYEKGSCENNHEMIRRVIPKGVDLGLYTQEQISLMMSHINSYTRKKLGDKSPYDVFAFQYGEEILKVLGLRKIPADEITLSPELLK